ncbi:hypothetical protein R1sor_026885 [Riccia sorocarpa]|uniref:UDP-N-acetylglucosamine transferase subunit ALG14 n=1 Tax=Riccia sorocarpa TaxID=122646 RepID=A0ABD3GCN0_9MARC
MEEDEQSGMRWWTILLGLLVVGFVSRLVIVWMFTGQPRVTSKDSRKERSLKTLIVLGSGGHTAEILRIVEKMNFENYSPRCYIAAVTDDHSLAKAKRLEEEKAGDELKQSRFYRIYRSREVGQSYITSVGTTLLAMAHAFYLAFSIRPDLIICNGPGTCLPVCIAGFVLKVLGVRWVVMVYVESIARVRKLSLTGLLFYKLHLMDQFFVQWPKLQQKFPRTQYVGRLM